MTQQPTLVHVPGILFRAVARTIARLVFVLAGAVLLLGLGLAFVSLFLATFRTARTHRMQVAADLAVTVYELVKSYR